MAKIDLLLLDADAVTDARLSALLTKSELGDRAGCSERTIWCVHRGIPIGIAKARSISRALGIPIERICFGSVIEAAKRARAITAQRVCASTAGADE
jgi:hypothetical protein